MTLLSPPRNRSIVLRLRWYIFIFPFLRPRRLTSKSVWVYFDLQLPILEATVAAGADSDRLAGSCVGARFTSGAEFRAMLCFCTPHTSI